MVKWETRNESQHEVYDFGFAFLAIYCYAAVRTDHADRRQCRHTRSPL